MIEKEVVRHCVVLPCSVGISTHLYFTCEPPDPDISILAKFQISDTEIRMHALSEKR